MKRFGSIVAAFALALVAVTMCAGALSARSGPEVYAACERGKGDITASALPAVLDEDRCPLAGRVIVDNGVAAEVPRSGESVLATATARGGGQRLLVSNPRGDEVVVEEAGDEAGETEPLRLASRSGANGCDDSFYDGWDMKVYNYNRWYVNARSIPSDMGKDRTIKAMRRAGNTIQTVRDACGLRDRVRGRLLYEGRTKRSVDMNARGVCNASDGRSVVGFGDLPRSHTARACVYSWIQNGPNRVSSADIRLNKVDANWTARVTGSCRGRYDVQSTTTHERGHHFGLGEASPRYHPHLTMNSSAGGTCRTFKRSLGRGDALGLNRKYR